VEFDGTQQLKSKGPFLPHALIVARWLEAHEVLEASTLPALVFASALAGAASRFQDHDWAGQGPSHALNSLNLGHD
jgi:hypothetical protein